MKWVLRTQQESEELKGRAKQTSMKVAGSASLELKLTAWEGKFKSADTQYLLATSRGLHGEKSPMSRAADTPDCRVVQVRLSQERNGQSEIYERGQLSSELKGSGAGSIQCQQRMPSSSWQEVTEPSSSL